VQSTEDELKNLGDALITHMMELYPSEKFQSHSMIMLNLNRDGGADAKIITGLTDKDILSEFQDFAWLMKTSGNIPSFIGGAAHYLILTIQDGVNIRGAAWFLRNP
jgi:hypothetical protein